MILQQYPEPRISILLTTNRLALAFYCSAQRHIKSFLYFCSVDVQQLSKWRSCTVGGPRDPLLLRGKYFLLYVMSVMCLGVRGNDQERAVSSIKARYGAFRRGHKAKLHEIVQNFENCEVAKNNLFFIRK